MLEGQLLEENIFKSTLASLKSIPDTASSAAQAVANFPGEVAAYIGAIGDYTLKLGIAGVGGAVAAQDETRAYFFGINGEVGPGELGAAFGTSGGQIEGQDEELMYEAYYSYPLNDGMTITPLLYVKEQATANVPDQTGVMVKTSFSF